MVDDHLRMQIIVQLVSYIAVVALGASGYFFTSALHEARSGVPLAFRNIESARYATSTFIWQRPISKNARRNYLISLTCASMAAGCAGIVMSIHGPMLGAWFFSGVFMIGTVVSLCRWRRYRARL